MSKSSTSETPGFTDPDDAPPVTQADVDKAVFRVGLEPVSRDKVRVEMKLDPGIVQFFKNRAGGRSYQALIQEALAEYVRGQTIENVVRQAIREELRRPA